MTYINTEVQGHILIITLNRPEARNAFNLAMAEEMEAVMDRYEEDRNLRVAIICANGPTFSAGQDLIAAARGERSVTKKRGGFGIMRVPPSKPLIAAVDGQALAGGMELSLCCDLIVASTTSVFGLAEAKRGLVAIGGGCFKLPKRIPYQIAMEIVLTAEPLPAERMYHFGYVNRLAPPGTVLEVAMAYAEVISRNGPLAVQASREIIRQSVADAWSDEEGWDKQMDIVAPVMQSADLKEGLKAFAEKRPAQFKGE